MDTFSCRSEFGSILRIPIVVMLSSIIICGLFLKAFFAVTSVVFGICILIMVVTWLLTSYRFSDDAVTVKLPSRSISIEYTSVSGITVPGDTYVIQGCSRRTIGIDYGKNNCVSISPVKRNEIIELLRVKCPNAVFKDLRPVPKDANA